MRDFLPPVASLEEVEARLRERADALQAFGVDRLTVFGSFARGDHERHSDVDLVVDPGPKTFNALLDLEDFLESALMRRVDVLTPGSLKPYLREEISQHGRVIELDAWIAGEQ